ncbi:hypothetical protein D3C85_1300780 [compost metagenome]
MLALESVVESGGIGRHGAIEKDRYIGDELLLLETVQVVHQQLRTPHREGGHQGDAPAQRGSIDHVRQLRLDGLRQVLAVTIGRLHEQVIGLVDGFRCRHDRVMQPPQITGTHQLDAVDLQLDGRGSQDVAGRTQQ